jgi:L-methionine (R)-S-oxide reductase
VEHRKQLFEEINSALSSADTRETRARRIAELIRQSRDYRWAGIYEIDGEEIAAIAWTGSAPPAFPRFPKTQGLCGEAVRVGATVVVGDVAKDPRYLTTFGSTQSEIVAPIFQQSSKIPLGLIDVESERLNAFTDDDRVFLEKCAAFVVALWP